MNNSRKVKNLSTGVVYKSVAEAAKSVKSYRATFKRSLDNNWKVGGYKWEYYD